MFNFSVQTGGGGGYRADVPASQNAENLPAEEPPHNSAKRRGEQQQRLQQQRQLRQQQQH